MLDARLIEEVLRDCLFKDEELVDGVPTVPPIKVEGIVRTFGFHPDRIEKHKATILGWIDDVPRVFLKEHGGGMSFLQLCHDRSDELWGQHKDMEELFVLCRAIGHAGFCLPPHMWGALPGGMPYVWFSKEKV
jgi:hypothetical protein